MTSDSAAPNEAGSNTTAPMAVPRNARGSREEPRYARGSGGGGSNFSPDWSREGAEPRYSDDPYYSRNRESSDDYCGGATTAGPTGRTTRSLIEREGELRDEGR